jgi:hypothetical protein
MLDMSDYVFATYFWFAMAALSVAPPLLIAAVRNLGGCGDCKQPLSH